MFVERHKPQTDLMQFPPPPVICSISDITNFATREIKQLILHKIITQHTEKLLKAKLCAGELGFTSYFYVLTSFFSDFLLLFSILVDVMACGVAGKILIVSLVSTTSRDQML